MIVDGTTSSPKPPDFPRRRHEMMRWRGSDGCCDGVAVFSSLARCTFPLLETTMKKQQSSTIHRRWLQNDPAAVRVWPSTGELWDELQLIGFLLFWPIRSYGYFAWRPYHRRNHQDDDPDDDDNGEKNINMIQCEPLDAIIDAQDIIDRLDLTTQPPTLRNEEDCRTFFVPRNIL
jgi:hypothetical protein